MFLGREPVLWSEAARVVMLALMGFHLIDWTKEQFSIMMLVVSTLLALATRSQVTPNQNVRSRKKA